MSTSLSIDTARSSDGELVLTAAGEIDLSNIEPFSRALAAAVADVSATQTLTVDLSDVEYLDSAAVNALFPHAERLHVIAHPYLVRIFDISGFSELAAVESASPGTGDGGL